MGVLILLGIVIVGLVYSAVYSYKYFKRKRTKEVGISPSSKVPADEEKGMDEGENMKECPYCKRMIPEDSKHCPFCGRKLEQEEREEEEQTYDAGIVPTDEHMGADDEEEKMKKCPFCAEWIKEEAIVCKHCHRDLSQEDIPPLERKTGKQIIFDKQGNPKVIAEVEHITGVDAKGTITEEQLNKRGFYDCGDPALGLQNLGGKCTRKHPWTRKVCKHYFCNATEGDPRLNLHKCYRRCIVCHKMLCKDHFYFKFGKSGAPVYCSFFWCRIIGFVLRKR